MTSKVPTPPPEGVTRPPAPAAPPAPPAYKANPHAIPGDRLLIVGDTSKGTGAVYIHTDDLLRMIDAMVVEGHNQISNRIMGRTGSEQMPVDDTQIGIEFAEDFLRKRIEKYGR